MPAPRLTRLLFCLVLAALCSLPPSVAHGSLPTLNAQWHLDEGAANDDHVSSTPDSSVNHFDTITQYTATVPGRFGTAFSSNGHTWTRTGSASLRGQEFTVMAWVKAAHSPGLMRYVLAQGSGMGCVPAAYGIYTSVAGTTNAGGLEFYVKSGGRVYTAPGVKPAQIWNGQWHMVAGTFDRFRARFYLDGIQIGDGVAVPGVVDYSQPDTLFTLGGYGRFDDYCGGTITGMGGHFDEVRQYGGALSPTEIERLADFGGADPPPLVPDVPIVHTTGVDQITTTGARVLGTIDNFDEDVLYRVQYGKTTAYGQFGPTKGLAGATGPQNIAEAITGLEPGTVYHARLVSGQQVGEDVTFTTPGGPPPPGTIRFSASTYSVAEDDEDGCGTVTLVRTGDTSEQATVHVATSNGTATAGSDYTSTSGTVTFRRDDDTSTVCIPIGDDAVDEPNETLFATISQPSSGYVIGSPSRATLTILDDDPPPVTPTPTPTPPASELHFSATSYTVPENGSLGRLTIQRTGDATQAATVHVSTADGTATAGSDYATTSGLISFAAGDTAKVVSVPIHEDAADEDHETLTVSLSQPSATVAIGSPDEATLTILDNDDPPPADHTPPTTTILLDPGSPGPGGSYTGPVGVTITASDGETRCTLNPPEPITAFEQMPTGCIIERQFLVGGAGTHTIYAGSRDAAGNTGRIVTRTFRIDELPDTAITFGPQDDVWRPDWLISFTSTVAGSSFECSMDGAAFRPCATPYDTGTLSQAAHTFAVRAVTSGGTVDPTPAARTFTVNGAFSRRRTCDAGPIHFSALLLVWSEPDLFGCQIGTPGPRGCSAGSRCTYTADICPVGARCTLTTRVQWYDADLHFNWGAVAMANTHEIDPDFGWANTAHRTRGSEAYCSTGPDGDRCSTQTPPLQVLGDGTPLWAGCKFWLPANNAWDAIWRSESVRRIECTAEWKVEPAPELAAVANGATVQVYVGALGVLAAMPSLAGSARAGVATAAARPAIAPVRRAVGAAGPVTIPLKLNAAAKRLLQRKRRLTVGLRITFTPSGGQPQTAIRNVTITATRPRPKACKALKPGKGRPRCVR